MSYIEDENKFRSNTWTYIGTGIEVPYILILFWAILLTEREDLRDPHKNFQKGTKDPFLP